MTYTHPYYTNYTCDDTGVIYGARGRPLKQIYHHTGYSVITCRHNGKNQRQLRSHRFMMECKLGRLLDPDEVINHIDGDKANNTWSNLEVCTTEDNARHAYKTGLRFGMKGTAHPSSKLTEQDVRDIRKATESQKEIAAKYGVHPQYVSLILSGRRWGHVKDD